MSVAILLKSSKFGLSEVIIISLELSDAIFPISFRLITSEYPTQPNKVIIFPLQYFFISPKTFKKPSGVCAKSIIILLLFSKLTTLNLPGMFFKFLIPKQMISGFISRA